MTVRTQPWDGTTVGDAGPYDADEWQDMYKALFASGEPVAATHLRNAGVLFHSGEVDLGGTLMPTNLSLKVVAQSPAAMSVQIRKGAFVANGIYGYSDANASLAIGSNVSGLTRIDRVVMRVAYATQNAALTLIAGTPGAGVPAMTQTDGVTWDIPLAQVSVASGAVTITDANITDEREYANLSPSVSFPFSTNSGAGGAATKGHVMTVNSSAGGIGAAADNTAKTFVGTIAETVAVGGDTFTLNSFGRGFVLTNAAVTRGDPLVPTATPGVLTPATANSGQPAVAVAMETRSTAGLVDALICPWIPSQAKFTTTAPATPQSGTNTSATLVPGWQVNITPRIGSLLMMAWGEARNQTVGQRTLLQLYNSTTAAQQTNTWQNILPGNTWYNFFLFAIQTNPSIGVANTIQMRASTTATGTWEVQQGHLFVMELTF